MRVAILDPFSGISGDMTLGALIAVGLPREWLLSLPSRLALDGVTVRIADVQRAGISCTKVDFDIPPQPHGRHIKEIRRLVAAAGVPADVQARADAVFTAIATVEGEIHGVSPERVHLHEVGAVDAILDVVGSVWGFAELGVERIYCGPMSVGDGVVEAAHGILPVPAPATLKLLEGLQVRRGPDGSGELVTPTGAALVKVLASGEAPREYIPLRSGFGAGTKEFANRANALRIVLADVPAMPDDMQRAATEQLVSLACDMDDMSPEYVADVADRLRDAGALDVVLLATVMKKGRPGTRLEVLVRPSEVVRLEAMLLGESTTLGVRRTNVARTALPRERREVVVLGQTIAVKVVRRPDGSIRAKPEYDDVRRVATVTGRSALDIFSLAAQAAEQGMRDLGNTPQSADSC